MFFSIGAKKDWSMGQVDISPSITTDEINHYYWVKSVELGIWQNGRTSCFLIPLQNLLLLLSSYSWFELLLQTKAAITVLSVYSSLCSGQFFFKWSKSKLMETGGTAAVHQKHKKRVSQWMKTKYGRFSVKQANKKMAISIHGQIVLYTLNFQHRFIILAKHI